MIGSEFRFKYTLYFSIGGIILIAIGIFFELNIFERVVTFVHQHEEYDIDEILLLLIPLLSGLTIDLINEKNRKKNIVEAERLKAFRATMNTVHDINNNFFSNLQYFVLKAREKELDDASIEEMDRLIFETADKLKQLGDLDHTKEINYAANVKGIDYSHKG